MRIKPNRIWLVMRRGRIIFVTFTREDAARKVEANPSYTLCSSKIWNVKVEGKKNANPKL